MREDKSQGDWNKNLKEAQVNMNKLFGNYQVSEFSFTFAGDGQKGKVTLFHKGPGSVSSQCHQGREHVEG